MHFTNGAVVNCTPNVMGRSNSLSPRHCEIRSRPSRFGSSYANCLEFDVLPEFGHDAFRNLRIALTGCQRLFRPLMNGLGGVSRKGCYQLDLICLNFIENRSDSDIFQRFTCGSRKALCDLGPRIEIGFRRMLAHKRSDFTCPWADQVAVGEKPFLHASGGDDWIGFFFIQLRNQVNLLRDFPKPFLIPRREFLRFARFLKRVRFH